MPHSWEAHLDNVHAAAAAAADVFDTIDAAHIGHAETLTGARVDTEITTGPDGETESPASGSGDR